MNVSIEGVNFGPPPVSLPASQVNRLLRVGDFLVDDGRRSGPFAGIVVGADGSIAIDRPGAYWVMRGKNGDVGSRATIRTAQYLCGIVGIILLYVAFVVDKKYAIENMREFVINFASDVFAVAAILLVAEYVDHYRRQSPLSPHRESQRRTATEGHSDDDADGGAELFRRPLAAAALE